MNPKPKRRILGLLGLLALSALCSCAPHVRPASANTLVRLQQHSSARRADEFPKGQLRLEYPVLLRPGTVLRVPLHGTHRIPTIPAELHSRPLPWIVDTGAAFPLLLDAESATQARLPVLEGARIKGTGVGGNTELLLGRFESLECAGQKVLGEGIAGVLLQSYRFKFAGVPVRRLPLNLLGLPFLELFSFVTLDAPAKKAELGYKVSFIPPKGAVSFPFQTHGGRLWVKVTIAGQEIPAFFDTGCGSTLRLPSTVLGKLPASAWASTHRSTRAAMGVGGVEMEEIGTLREAHIGGVRLTPVEYDTSPTTRDAMLGWGPFRKNRITIDFQRKCVWVEPTVP